MTNADFLKGLSGEQLAFAENLLSQRDDTLARINKATSDLTTLQTSTQKQIADLNTQHQVAIDKLNSDRQAQIDGMNTQTSQVASQLADAQKLIDVLGGTALGQQMAKQKQHDDMVAQQKQLQAQIEQLSKDLAVA